MLYIPCPIYKTKSTTIFLRNVLLSQTKQQTKITKETHYKIGQTSNTSVFWEVTRRHSSVTQEERADRRRSPTTLEKMRSGLPQHQDKLKLGSGSRFSVSNTAQTSQVAKTIRQPLAGFNSKLKKQCSKLEM